MVGLEGFIARMKVEDLSCSFGSAASALSFVSRLGRGSAVAA